MTRVVRCKVENILGAKNIEFAPNGGSVTIGGKNGQGKSSAIWALAMALGGKRVMPDAPVFEGAEEGRVTIELDKYLVQMEVDTKRGSKLVIETKDGTRFSSPQKILNELFGALSFDPGEFLHFDAKKRRETLVALVGLDLKVFDVQEESLCMQRQDLYGVIKVYEGKAEGAVIHADVPDEETPVSEIAQRLKECQEINRELYATKDLANKKQAEVNSIVQRMATTSKEILSLEQSIVSLKNKLEELSVEKGVIEREALELTLEVAEKLKVRNTEAEALALSEQLLTAEDINRKISENKETARLRALIVDKQADYEAFNKKIDEVRKLKIAAIEATKFPIQGLSFNDGDVLFNDIPFEQLAESEKWEVSTAIGFTINKQGIVFMRHSGGLDRDSRDRIRERAAALGVQLFLEVVDDADDVQVVIHEGMVKENRLESSGLTQ